MIQFLAIFSYFCFVLLVGFFSYRKQTTSAEFLIGNRSLNYWLTALAAHASDMSNWLFMGYPAIIFIGGLFNAWVAIGLTLCMLLNWQWIAPKIRRLTEETQTLTLSSFFEHRLEDKTGRIRLFSAGICFLFYTIYIAAGLIGLGILAQSLLGVSYTLGVLLGIAIVVSYVLIGGFITLAWLDLFQGLFLLIVILVVPCILLPKVGGISGIHSIMQIKDLPFSLFPSMKSLTLLQIISLSLGWGLGYFGQPHIITKFMGIRDVKKISKSKWVGMSWMVLSLLAATFVGFIALGFFPNGIDNPEMIFIEMVKQSFSPFLIGIILCAIIAAIINVMSSQMLVLSSILSEDFYKQFFHRNASDKKLLFISRMGILGVAFIALGIAYINPGSIFSLVEYAWSGLGAAFGPLLLYMLYSKRASKFGAWVGMLSGGAIAATWPFFNTLLPISIHPLLPAFLLSLGLNWAVSQWTAIEAAPQET